MHQLNTPPRAGPSQQRTRFAPSRFSSTWEKVKKHLTPPSHPSTTSESAIDSSFNHTDNFYLESEGQDRTSRPTLDLLNPLAGTTSRHKRGGNIRRRQAKSSAANSNSRYGDDDDRDANPSEAFGHTVVEADFEQFVPPAAKSESGSTNGDGGKASGTGLFSKASKEGEDDDPELGAQGTRSDSGSVRRDRRQNWVQRSKAYEVVVERLWPNIKHFLDSSYPEPSKERAFQKETWFMTKSGAIASATYFLIAWILTTSLLPMPLTPFNWGVYVGAGGILTAPIILFVFLDLPRRATWLYRPWLAGATWVFADILIIEMHVCGFFTFDNQCGTRNFLNLFAFAYGQPTLAVFALRQSRIWSILGAVQWLVLIGSLLMTEENYPTLFYRNIVMFCFFHAFIIGTSFLKERSDRQMFALRQQLKIQYRATQSAQVMERRASDSKKRFVSYIFHEVRVPLNTALLAVQNLDGENVFKGLAEDQAEMVHGLMGSLTMMEKVLNDVLSFNRMESGKFAQARKPFEFHKSIQLVALSHRVQAQMAGIDLIVELDKDIDKIGGMFVGDEMRLRQVTSNLVSNSIKFTEKGSVRIVTKLLYPRFEPTPSTEIDDPLKIAAANASAQAHVQHIEYDPEKSGDVTLNNDPEKGSVALETRRQSRDSTHEKERDERRKRKAVVRVEIHDTGVGLKKQDVVDNRLFSPYVQTEIGRRQGGKGSGLGLALVRQIVKLSNGRLGVESQVGKGSMFWFELPYSLPAPRRESTHLDVNFLNSPRLDRSPLAQPAAALPSPRQPPMPTIEQPTPPLVIARDHQPHRPNLPLSDSSLPLLPEQHGGRRRMPSEEVVLHTFPSTYTDTSTSGLLPGSRGSSNPFDQVRPIPERAPSDWSGATKLDSPTDRRSSISPNTRNVDVPPITVPAATSPSAVPGPSSPAIGEPPMCTLVVDDDKLTRMLMSRMLTRLGHQVTTAENGKIALQMLTDSYEGKEGIPRFDVLFLDNQMPLMSGVEVAQHVRDMGNHIYIVGCTGNALREDQEEYLSAGADDIIPKPIHQKAVLEVIKEARKRISGETAYTVFVPGSDDKRGSRGV